MDAIDYLRRQHHEMERAMAQVLEAGNADGMRSRFADVADQLTMHIESEEQVFYPAVKAQRTEDILLESLEEHLGIKRVLSDLIDLDADDETFDAKAKVLQEQVEHHVEEEEGDLFPKVKKIFDEETLVAIAQQMAELQEELLAKGNPRLAVPGQTDEAAPL